MFSEYNYKAGIYLYPPSVGVFNPASAKWIIFFYLNDFNSSVPPEALSNIEDQLLIYPNPCKNYLTIVSESYTAGEYHFEIIDLSGKSLMKQQIYISTIEKVNVSSINTGIYILSIKNHKLLFNTIFVKN